MTNLKKTKTRIGERKDAHNIGIVQDTQFAALFYIRNTNVNLDRDLTEVLASLQESEELNKRSSIMFKINLSSKENDKCLSILSEIKDETVFLKEQLLYLKDNIVEKNMLNSFIFWLQNEFHINNIAQNYKILRKLALQVLAEEEKLYWRTSICNTQDEIFSLIASLTGICKVELDFIEKYIPDTIDINSQKIIDSIADDCTLEEAKNYQRNYQEISDNYQGFQGKQNIWDKLLIFFTGYHN